MATAIKCGKCKGTHGSAQEVRVCYQGGPQDPIAKAAAADLAAINGTTHAEAKAAIVKPQAGPAATEKQVAFLNSLLAERPAYRDVMNLWPDHITTDKLTKAQASTLITEVLAVEKEVADAGPQWPDVPEGHYAVTSLTGNNDLDFFRIDRPTDGKWKGRTFVKRVIGGKPDVRIAKGQVKPILEAIVAAGVEAARTLYGKEIGRCWRCNRHLTDETSRALGIGPDCREMVGM